MILTGDLVTIVCDTLRKKWRELSDKNQERQQDEAYEKKRRELIEKNEPSFEEDIKKLQEVVEDLKKAQK